jgi:hypothetical protein
MWNWLVVSSSSTFYKQLLCWYSCAKKLQSQNVTKEKLLKTFVYEKGPSKMMTKLIPIVNLINILQAAIALIFLHQKITKPNCRLKKSSTKHLYEKFARKMLVKSIPRRLGPTDSEREEFFLTEILSRRIGFRELTELGEVFRNILKSLTGFFIF